MRVGALTVSDLEIILRHTTLGRTPLEQSSVCRIDLYLSTHNANKRQTSMSPAGFKPTISASQMPQFQALERVTTGISNFK